MLEEVHGDLGTSPIAFQKQGDEGPKKYLGVRSQDQEQWRNNFTNVLGGSFYGEGRTARYNQAVDLDHGQVGAEEHSTSAI